MSGDGLRQLLDSEGEVLVGGFERFVGVRRYRIGNAPVQPGTGREELLVGGVAHRDDQFYPVTPWNQKAQYPRAGSTGNTRK